VIPRFQALVAVAAFAIGCAGFGQRISYFDMAPRLSYQGFSFDRPPAPEWFILRSEESYTDVTLRRETGSPTHTFYASVSLGGLERQPQSHEDFFGLARSRGQQAPYSIHELSRVEKLLTIQNQWCLRRDTVAVVRGAPQAPDRDLHMTVRGYRCLHPAFPKTTLDFFYSERGLPEELDPKLAEEGEAFLRGVRIDVAPDTPAS
jgi:hypothetical protein